MIQTREVCHFLSFFRSFLFSSFITSCLPSLSFLSFPRSVSSAFIPPFLSSCYVSFFSSLSVSSVMSFLSFSLPLFLPSFLHHLFLSPPSAVVLFFLSSFVTSCRSLSFLSSYVSFFFPLAVFLFLLFTLSSPVSLFCFFVTLLSSRFHFLYSLCCLFLHLSPPILLLSLRLVFSFLFVTYIFHRLLSFVLLFHCIYSCRLSVLSLALSFLSSCLSPLMVSFSFYSFPGFFLFSFLSYLL